MNYSFHVEVREQEGGNTKPVSYGMMGVQAPDEETARRKVLERLWNRGYLANKLRFAACFK